MERIAIIGGSGLYAMDELKRRKSIFFDTPFGKPSGKLILGQMQGREVIFLPRHDVGHRLCPSDINYRANIFALKKLNVGWVISVTACGSLKEELRPLDFVVVDQFVDRTNSARQMSFFTNCGLVAHISFAHPVCKQLASLLYEAGKSLSLRMHPKGTYLNMEGPAFSTLAESNLYRSWNMDVIGMTNLAEARLAREAQMCYSTLACVTDYDCWHPSHDSVTVEMIIANLKKNIENAKKIISCLVKMIPQQRECSCQEALKYAIVTDPKVIPTATKKKLKPIIGKYIS